MDAYTKEIESWRARRLARLTEPWSWLSLVERTQLVDGPNAIGPGTFTRRADGTVQFRARPGVTVGFGRDPQPEDPRVVEATLTPDRDERLLFEGRRYELLARESAAWIRVRDPGSPARASFVGIRYFPIDPRYRVLARWERYLRPKELRHDYEEGPQGELLQAPGRAHFDIDGQALSLEPVIEGNGRRLHVLFGDRTNREEDGSYGAGRFLYSEIPTGSELVLDFNQAFNPPCAFTDFAVCPLIPSDHRLPVRIPAGEKRP